jgi:hypothetical protein
LARSFEITFSALELAERPESAMENDDISELL